MREMIKGIAVSPKENNALYERGFKYYVEGDWEITEGIDGWSGMPNTTGNVHYFTDKAEAEEYAKAQTWVFNKDIHGVVREMVHRETLEEYEARIEAEKERKRERKEKRDRAKAEEMGMTIEEYNRFKKVQSIKKRYAKEITDLEEEIKHLQREIEYRKNFINEN